MGAFRQKEPVARFLFFCSALAGSWIAGHASPLPHPKQKADAWQLAVSARSAFEAQTSHTEADYSRVMEGFRAIYHSDPADVHAPRAVQQVAELLAEEGHERHNTKSLHDAARQYEFLADQYPASSLAADSLRRALELLEPEQANDGAEARKVRAELAEKYPRYAREQVPREANTQEPEAQAHGLTSTATAERSSNPLSPAPAPIERRVEGKPEPPDAAEGDANTQQSSATPVDTTSIRRPVAQVTGIRHWSTSNYTRVAIDLGDEVQYQAARVENPDRIFFDLHHAHLAPQLAGKSFTVTDDGFLTKIRAAQFSGDVTRVVLDVHEVTEYSAFLLPNPYRLIIDIHGKRPGEPSSLAAVGGKEQKPVPSVEETVQEPLDGSQKSKPNEAKEPAKTSLAEQSVARKSPPPQGAEEEHYVPPSRRVSNGAEAANGSSQSLLPPMPVTDGSAGFGLPAKDVAGATTSKVAPPRVVIPAKPTANKPVPNTVTTHIADTSTSVAAVSHQPGKVEATSRPTSQPIAERSKGAVSREKGMPHTVGTPAQPAPPTVDGETSLVRALGLKIGRIVIDAGHGGHDSGTLGVDGIEEKDVVLDVALRLGKLLHDRLGAEIVYTRADDTFIPLETRTAIANKAQADLFISVHANSSPDEDARGVEVYYLNFTSDPDAMRVASRENAVSTQSIHELSDLVKKITLKDKIDESRELATDVDETLYKGLAKGNEGLKNRGVKKAPFVVLIGANMPSILAEISFVTNPTDAQKLSRPEYRQRVAESLYGGVARYAGSINGRPPSAERAASTAGSK